jgi:hypothetical protein
MMRWSPLLFFSWLAACASSGNTTASRQSAVPIEGIYDYVANISGQQVQGKLRVLGDTIIVEPHSDYCRPVVGAPSPLSIRYTCNGPGSFESLLLTLDRRNPAQFSKWSASFRVRKQRQICTQYAVRDGQQVCVQYGMETYEVTESRSGTLQVRRPPP